MSVQQSSTEVIFINVYRAESGRAYCGGVFPSKVEGEAYAAQGIGFLGSYEVTIPTKPFPTLALAGETGGESEARDAGN